MKITIKGYTRKGKKGNVVVKAYVRGVGKRRRMYFKSNLSQGEEYKNHKEKFDDDTTKTPEELVEEVKDKIIEEAKEKEKEKAKVEGVKKDNKKSSEKTTYAKKAPDKKSSKKLFFGMTAEEWDKQARRNSFNQHKVAEKGFDKDGYPITEEAKRAERARVDKVMRKHYVDRGEAIPQRYIPKHIWNNMTFWEKLDNKIARHYQMRGKKFKSMTDYSKFV